MNKFYNRHRGIVLFVLSAILAIVVVNVVPLEALQQKIEITL